MAKVYRGKALVAKLRAQAGVRDAEALAAYLGRFKKARKAGKSVSEAASAARGSGGSKKSPLADIAAEGGREEESKEEKQQRRYEEAQVRQMEKEERSRLHNIFREQGGVKVREDLKEEYRAIPKNLKGKDGMAGDEMADYLATYYPEFGIESENDLLDYFAPNYAA